MTRNKYIVVHYARSSFEAIRDEIYCLFIYDSETDAYTAFDPTDSKYNEQTALEAYSEAVKSFVDRGHEIIHWNQNSPVFGPDHINERYREMTGNELNLWYGPRIVNLANELIERHGNDYVNHPRLDNLALLNGFKGYDERSEPCPLFDYRRTSLIVKILHLELAGNLKIKTDVIRDLESDRNVLERLKAELKLSDGVDQVLTRLEVIELLGISSSTLSNWVRDGEIDFTRIGRRLYFKKSQILN